ncbi:MAG: hypothetical protein COB51_12920 [Moraxellaceae bacterium]|nr:MAG: hypothetical protein COB51_12920 [Moraxellaceae bacterium]
MNTNCITNASIKPLLVLIFSFYFSYASAEVIVFTDNESVISAGSNYVEYLLDPESTLTIDDILNQESQHRFSPIKNNIPNFGFSDSSVWLKFTYHDQRTSSRNNNLLLEIAFPILDYIEIYRLNEQSYQKHKTGLLESYDSREINNKNYLFYLSNGKDKPATVYLRIRSETPLFIPLFISSIEHSLGEGRLESNLLGLFSSIFITLLLYNICLSFTLKDKSHIYYVCYIFAISFSLSFLNGVLQPFLGSYLTWTTENFWGLTSCVFIFVALFISELLSLPTRLPGWALLFRCMIALLIVNSLVVFATDLRLWLSSIVLTAAVAAILFAVFIYCAYLKLKAGYIGLFAFSPSFIAFFLFTLSSSNVIDAGWWTFHGIYLGLAVTLVLLSISVGDKINSEKNKRHVLETRIRSTLEENNELLRKTNSVKDAFISTISHELRTPLNGVLGALSLLAKTAEPSTKTNHSDVSSRAINYTELACESAENMLALVNNIIGFTELHRGQTEPCNRFFPPYQSTLNAIESHRDSITKKGLSLHTNIDSLMPIEIYSDEAQYTKAISILIENACKFTDSGEIKISASFKMEAGGKTQLILIVSDTGIGIPADKREEILEPFLQADQTFTRRFGGLGIGMTVCKKIMDLQDGEILIGDNDKKGARITLKFSITEFRTVHITPATDEKNEIGISNSRPLAETSHNLRPASPLERILIVEDDETNQAVCQSMIKSLGYEVCLANNGSEALDRLTEEAFDLVLMDCCMPVMDGFEATEKIRSRQSAYQDIPIIAVTANASMKDHNHCLESGMNEYISKPINIGLLKAALNRFDADPKTAKDKAP